MKNLTLILFAIILIYSCRKPEPIIYTFHDRIIENNSSHSIKIKNLAYYDIDLQKNENFKKEVNGEGESPPQIYGYLIQETDSIEVIYDDTLTVYHGSKHYTMYRDLRRNDMFDLDESQTNGFNHYTYTYTFTDADYEEAKTK